MLQKLSQFNKENALFNENDRLAVAVSGGIDSVCAAHLLNEMKIPFGIVHCNFKLRSIESDKDESFVRQLAEELKYCEHFHSTTFDTALEVVQHGKSVQEMARQLRYEYFEQLRSEGVFDKLITGHHKDDNRESFFINLYRVSGVKGLAGIPLKRDYIIRPLMAFTREEITAYMKSNKQAYRQDESNSSDVYLRNKIRHHIIPPLEEHLEGFGQRLDKSMAHLKSGHELLDFFMQKLHQECCEYDSKGELLSIDLESIATYPHAAVILYSILDKLGFSYTQCSNILDAKWSGSEIATEAYLIIKDRSRLIISANAREEKTVVQIDQLGNFEFSDSQFSLERTEKKPPSKNSNIQIVDFDKLLLPLELRYWEAGDYIYPLGMDHRKKLSDLFVDAKINKIDKHKIPLLAKGNEIFWVVGHKISNKVKITENTSSFCQLSMVKSAS